MPLITNTVWNEGDIPTAAALNAPYDSAATASAAVDGDNCKDNWITIFHFGSGNPCNNLYSFVYDGTSEFSTSSTSYVTINSTGVNPAEVSLNYAPNQYEVLRLEASGLVTNIDAAVTYDETLPAGSRGNPNYYAFRLLLTYNDGGGNLTTSLGEWGYSFTSAGGDGRYYTTLPGDPEETGVPLGYQTFQFSTLYTYTGTTGVRTLVKVELQAKVYDNTNVLKVDRNNIIAVRAKH